MLKKVADKPLEVPDPEDDEITYNYKFDTQVLHIHGDLNSNIVIGVDSISQFTHKINGSEDDLKDFAVKKSINFYSDSQRESNYVSIIDNSNAILMYGLSLGETDKSRWEKIKEWLKVNSINKLIYFAYQTNINQIREEYSPRISVEIKKIKKDVLLKLGFAPNELTNYYDQVFIIDSSDVLNFKLVADNNFSHEGVNTFEENRLTLEYVLNDI